MAERDSYTEDAGKVKDDRYADTLQEMLKRWDYATDQWQEIRYEADYDMRCVSGDPWDPKDRRAREDAGRPCLSLDEITQYTNQLINDVRQHKRAIKVTPMGSGANDQTAELRANLYRQIEYRSNAQVAYTTMFENTVNRSYGYARVKARYATDPGRSGGDGSSFNQELVIEPIVNPNLVTIDPDALKPDGSDMKYAWVAESWSYEDYRRKFPKAKVVDFDSQLAKRAPTWMDARRIRIAEYWTVESEPRTLLLFKGQQQRVDGSRGDLEVFEEDLKLPEYAYLANVDPDRERTVEKPIVTKYLTNGFEVLEPPSVWPGKTIPIACCYGKVLYVDEGSGAKRKMMSLVRLARDPYMLYCYYRTAEAEQVGMSTKFPYFIRRGSLDETQKLRLQESLHQPVAMIEVNATSDQLPTGMVPEMPVRNPFEPAIQALEVGAEGARRAIQAAMGISPLPTDAQKYNQKSGKALDRIHDSEQQGSFHFIDAYEMAIARIGTILDEVAPVYYDTARDVAVRTPANETQMVRINDPNPPQGQEPVSLGEGDHDITLSTGPSFDSERDQANDFADTLVSEIGGILPAIGPPAAAKLLSLSVKLKDLGPIGDEIAELLSPPDPGNGLPPQVAHVVQSLQQENAGLKQAIQTDRVKQEAQLKKAALDNASKERIEAANRDLELQKTWITVSAQLIIAGQKVGAENTRSLADALEKRDATALGAHLETVHKIADIAHEANQAEADRTHEVGMALLEHHHALAEAQQAAELAPEPAPAGNAQPSTA